MQTPNQPGPYWCSYHGSGGWNAIVFLAGQAPLLQVVGLHVVTEDFDTRSRFTRAPDLAAITFGPRVTFPAAPPDSAQ